MNAIALHGCTPLCSMLCDGSCATVTEQLTRERWEGLHTCYGPTIESWKCFEEVIYPLRARVVALVNGDGKTLDSAGMVSNSECEWRQSGHQGERWICWKSYSVVSTIHCRFYSAYLPWITVEERGHWG